VDPRDKEILLEKPEELQEYWDTFKEPLEIPRMTDDKLREFVDDYVSGRIFTLDRIRDPEREMGMVFCGLMFGPFERYNPDSLGDIGNVYEYMSQAGPRSINGYPFFTSFRLIHKKDWKRALKMIPGEIERRKAVELPPDDEEET